MRDPLQRAVTGIDHYENFPVASVLVPRALRPAVVALYRFARHGDDVADEGDAPAADRLAELARMRAALDGEADHPAVGPLLPHLERHALSRAECSALLSAFEQDVRRQRYADEADLRDYCTRSANPVGHLMLELFGCRTPENDTLSDAICTALQLINFLQDTAIDWRRGRLYVPCDQLAAAGLDEDDLVRAVAAAQSPPALRALFAARCRTAGALLESGASLAGRVPWRLGLELRAIVAGGLRIVRQIERDGFDPIARRPKIGWRDALPLLAALLLPNRLHRGPRR